MCLIISGTSREIRNTLINTKDLMEDIYVANPDGIGAMYVTSKGRLRTPKLVPKNLAQFEGFIKQMPDDDRALAIHARFKTHGDVDLANCHPYTVVEDQIAMMHNGVLAQGNAADKTKSDTWHYIHDFIAPQLALYPKLYLLPAWQALVEADITGGNRFVFMDNAGELVILNKDTGIEHAGLWFSNTYAWSPELLIPGYAKPRQWGRLYPGGYGSALGGNVMPIGAGRDRYGLDQYDFAEQGYEDGDYYIDTAADGQPAALDPTEVEDWANEVWTAVAEADPHFLNDLLIERPYLTLRSLTNDYEFRCSVDAATELATDDQQYVKLLEDGDVLNLVDCILKKESIAMKISEVICWYGDWYGKAINDKLGSPQVMADANAEVYAG